MTQDELVEDPHDFVASYLVDWAEHFSMGTKSFYAYYLLSHGAVKLLLVVGLMKEKSWAYPVSLAVMALFIIYQLYRFPTPKGWV